jgi:branched-chain amino acid transport system substrate-binding protein
MAGDWIRMRRPMGLAALLLMSSISMPANAQECEVKLGSVGPMSGGASAWGLANKAAAEFVAALVNEEGGIQLGDKKCKVRIVAFDALYTAAGGAAAANALASEGVHITLGPVGSPETTGFREVAKRNGIVNFSSSYMRDVIGPDFPLAFHALQAPVTFGPILVKKAKERFNFESVVIVGTNDQGGTDGTKQLLPMYEENGVKAQAEYYQRGTTNFAAIATRIMTLEPDVVDIATMPPADQATLLKQLLEAGYEGDIGSLGGGGFKPIEEGSGGVENLKNAYWLEVSPVDHPGVVKMKEEYQRVMGQPAPDNPIFSVFTTAAEVALQGVSRAGTDQDGEKIAEELRKLTPESRFLGAAGWRGKTLYGSNQELTFPIGMGLVVDGKKMPVENIEIPTEQ